MERRVRTRASLPTWAFLGLPVLVVLLLGGRNFSQHRRSASTSPPELAGWDLPHLVEHLRRHGLDVQQVPVDQHGTVTFAAFLTTTGKTWEDLGSLPKLPEEIRLWQGTVYVEHGYEKRGVIPVVEVWGDCGLVAGPFVFFGDRLLLAQIRAALLGGGPEANQPLTAQAPTR